jgi:hypothetical protein
MLLLVGIACSAPKKSSLEKRKKIQEQRKQKGSCPNNDCT